MLEKGCLALRRSILSFYAMLLSAAALRGACASVRVPRRCRGLTEDVTARAVGYLVAGAVAHLRSAYGKGGTSVPHAPSAAASCGWGYEECRTAGAKRRVVFFVGMQCDAWRCRGRRVGSVAGGGGS